MPHSVMYNPELHVIETITHGNVTFTESKEIIAEIIQTGTENNCFLCLSDYRDENIQMSTMEIYYIPKIISDVSAAYGISAEKFKRAVVIRKDLQDFHFFETVSLNQGQKMKLFEDIEEAKKWLLET